MRRDVPCWPCSPPLHCVVWWLSSSPIVHSPFSYPSFIWCRLPALLIPLAFPSLSFSSLPGPSLIPASSISSPFRSFLLLHLLSLPRTLLCEACLYPLAVGFDFTLLVEPVLSFVPRPRQSTLVIVSDIVFISDHEGHSFAEVCVDFFFYYLIILSILSPTCSLSPNVSSRDMRRDISAATLSYSTTRLTDDPRIDLHRTIAVYIFRSGV